MTQAVAPFEKRLTYAEAAAVCQMPELTLRRHRKLPRNHPHRLRVVGSGPHVKIKPSTLKEWFDNLDK